MDSIPCHRGSAVFLGTMASNFKGTLMRAQRRETERDGWCACVFVVCVACVVRYISLSNMYGGTMHALCLCLSLSLSVSLSLSLSLSFFLRYGIHDAGLPCRGARRGEEEDAGDPRTRGCAVRWERETERKREKEKERGKERTEKRQEKKQYSTSVTPDVAPPLL